MQNQINLRLGDYLLESVLGRGGFAVVYKAKQIHLGTPVAIKILLDSFAPQQLEALREEARIVDQLRDHPQIVHLQTFSIERERNIPYLVMDYIAGGSLDKFHSRGKTLPLPTVVTYVRQIAAALQYAHERRIIHRDIKPANFLLKQDGRVLVADFGIALMAQHSMSWKQEKAGSPEYMAPEQLQGKAVPASDQYALGVVVYQWLCGQPPFTGLDNYHAVYFQHVLTPPPPLRERNPDISPEIEQVVLKALAKKPEERYANILEFSWALEQAANPLAPGQRLGDYQLTRFLGSGNFGEVYEAQQVYTRKQVAIKFLKDKLRPEQEEIWCQEACTVTDLFHQYIIRVIAFSVEPQRGWPYLVTAYADGGSLETVHPQGQPLPMETILVYVRQIAAALQYAHERQIIHRNIKPENIHLSKDGHVQIVDFGIAVMASTTQSYKAEQIVSPWQYMAPEQYEGKATPASDQYALAVMVYRWLCGELPFANLDGPHQLLTTPPLSLREKVPNLSPAIAQVILKALAKQPEERFDSIQTFADALQAAHKQPPLATKPLKGKQKAAPVSSVAKPPEPSNAMPPVRTAPFTGKQKADPVKTVVLSPELSSKILPIATIPPIDEHKADPIKAVAEPPKSANEQPTTGTLLLTYKHKNKSVLINSVAWSPDGCMLALGSDDKTIQVWEATTEQSQPRSEGHSPSVNAPNTHSITSGNQGKNAQASGATVDPLQSRSDSHAPLAVASHERSQAADSKSKTVPSQDATAGTSFHRYDGHSAQVSAVAWSPAKE